MAKYLLVYGGGSMPESDAAQAQVMAAWESWFGSLGSAVVDPGNPTSQSREIRADGSVGEASHPATGYSIISAGDLDAAVGLARSCPVRAAGGSIEVAEILEIM